MLDIFFVYLKCCGNMLPREGNGQPFFCFGPLLEHKHTYVGNFSKWKFRKYLFCYLKNTHKQYRDNIYSTGNLVGRQTVLEFHVSGQKREIITSLTRISETRFMSFDVLP